MVLNGCFVSLMFCCEDERPFSNGRGGEQFDRNEDVLAEDDYLSRLRQELDLSSFSDSASSPATTTSKPKPKPIKCHTGLLSLTSFYISIKNSVINLFDFLPHSASKSILIPFLKKFRCEQ